MCPKCFKFHSCHEQEGKIIFKKKQQKTEAPASSLLQVNRILLQIHSSLSDFGQHLHVDGSMLHQQVSDKTQQTSCTDSVCLWLFSLLMGKVRHFHINRFKTIEFAYFYNKTIIQKIKHNPFFTGAFPTVVQLFLDHSRVGRSL